VFIRADFEMLVGTVASSKTAEDPRLLRFVIFGLLVQGFL
jgi:hypothetical protein